MPRQFLKRVLPGPEFFERHPLPFNLTCHLRDTRLWHFGRRSVSRGAGMGMFIALIPVPFQMVIVVVAAIILRFNLPVAFFVVFITNPLTMGPVYYLTYRLGTWLLGMPGIPRPEEITFDWFFDLLEVIWLPLYLGSLVTGVVAGSISLLLIDFLWAVYIGRKRRRRQPS
jgi:uncharacterized protein (DUF2062 family)